MKIGLYTVAKMPNLYIYNVYINDRKKYIQNSTQFPKATQNIKIKIQIKQNLSREKIQICYICVH